MRITFQEVKQRCAEGRFFRYEGFHDNFFVPPSIWLVWFFVNLGWSGNAVSWLSGLITVAGGCLLASQDKTLILIGSFSYISFYLLDYVDGGVSRLRKSGGISGQYVDWIMHVVSAVSIFSGIALGACQKTGTALWLLPFAVCLILGIVLQLDRHAFGWWTICMHLQQFKTTHLFPVPPPARSFQVPCVKKFRRSFFRISKSAIILFFHENITIFTIPFFAILHFFDFETKFFFPDFRVVLTVLGGTYFFCISYEIILISKKGLLEKSYEKLFFTSEKPDLPREHFFN